MGFSFLSKRPALVLLLLLLHQFDSKHEFLLQARGSTPRSHLFAHFFSLRHAHLGNVMQESHWRRTPRWQMLHAGTVMELSCMADINRPLALVVRHGRIGPPSKARNPTRSVA
jgi:hypothetical protein